MNELNLKQTDLIAQYVRGYDIVFSHLHDDLVDHICCDIEEMMKSGARFEDAITQVRLMIGDSGLRDIQKDTLFAVDSKYRKMKKTMKISGVAGAILLGLSSVFKIMHLPMAGIMLLLGALILIILFLPSSLMVLWKESKSRKRLFLFISAFLASSLFIAGVIFKIQHWPGSGFVITCGIISAILLFIPSLVIHMINEPDRKIPKWIIITGGITVALYWAGLLMKIIHLPASSLLLTTSTLYFVIVIIPGYFYHRWGKDEYVSIESILAIAAMVLFLVPSHLIDFSASLSFDEMYNSTSDINRKSLDFRILRNEELLKNPLCAENEDLVMLHNEAALLLDLVDKIEDSLMEPAPGIMAEDKDSGINGQISQFNYQATLTLFSEGETLVKDLENRLKSYKEIAGNLIGNPQDNTTISLLDLNFYLSPYDNTELQFIHIAPVALIQSLDLLKASVLDAEAAAIRNMTSDINLTK